MSTLDAAGMAQLARRLDLVTDHQVDEALMELGSRTGPPEPLLKYFERRGYITPLQASKLIKGDTDGYFLGGYRLLYRIAAGSFGRVYRADNPRTGEVVAIKVLRKRWADDQRKIEMFEREGKIGMQMAHPNIVKIIGVGRDPVTLQYYIIMEFVEGGDLRDFLDIRKKLDIQEGLKHLEEMASALAHALDLGLSHRDLKPTNILISSTRATKLVDFGLAELAGKHKEESADAIDRTVDYAGLEKATGVKKGDARSDIFFLGCTFHEMITGRPLIVPTRDQRAAMVKSRFEVAPLVRRDDPDLPPPVYSLLQRMVAFDPNMRFQTYDQITEAIAQVRLELAGGGKVAASASGPKTVFIVEQHPKLQDAFRDKLKKRGYKVLISINPPQAQTRFQQQPYDALIVDCGTAGREGLEVYNQIMQAADLKRLECSGILILNEDQADWANEVAEVPKSAILVRPVMMAQITAQLEEFVPLAPVEEDAG